MLGDIPISIDDPEKDEGIIRDRLVDELCKRQKNFDRNGGSQRWSVTEIWQSSFPAVTNRQHIDKFIDKYRNDSEYFDIDSHDTIGLTERGKKFCKDLERYV